MKQCSDAPFCETSHCLATRFCNMAEAPTTASSSNGSLNELFSKVFEAMRLARSVFQFAIQDPTTWSAAEVRKVLLYLDFAPEKVNQLCKATWTGKDVTSGPESAFGRLILSFFGPVALNSLFNFVDALRQVSTRTKFSSLQDVNIL